MRASPDRFERLILVPFDGKPRHIVVLSGSHDAAKSKDKSVHASPLESEA
jgi:hypothetical protein